MAKHPAVPYVVPFAVFLAFLALKGRLGFAQWEYAIRVVVLSLVIWTVSRRVIDLRVRFALPALLAGAGVFLVWIGPDVLWPGYRTHWLFENFLTGKAESSLLREYRQDGLTLLFRVAQAVILVPILEELFWRGWLMRWLIHHEFEKVPLGAYAARSFWITAVMFASEHGAYWEVGLIAGMVYNWWMIRSKSLGDCIAAHAMTNACLSAYVIVCGRWEYWM